jgi:hypothetical protein
MRAPRLPHRTVLKYPKKCAHDDVTPVVWLGLLANGWMEDVGDIAPLGSALDYHLTVALKSGQEESRRRPMLLKQPEQDSDA